MLAPIPAAMYDSEHSPRLADCPTAHRRDPRASIDWQRMQKGNAVTWLFLLPLLALGWMPLASGETAPAPDYSEYVYLHMTRGVGAAPAKSCRGRVETIRS